MPPHYYNIAISTAINPTEADAAVTASVKTFFSGKAKAHPAYMTNPDAKHLIISEFEKKPNKNSPKDTAHTAARDLRAYSKTIHNTIPKTASSRAFDGPLSI